MVAAGPTGPQHNPGRKSYPDGWQPRSEVDDVDGGFVVSKPMPVGHTGDHRAVLDEFGLNPDEWSIERVKRTRWQKYDESWLEAVRISILPAHTAQAARLDVDALVKEIGKFRPRAKAVDGPGDGAFIHPVGDTQVGKSEGGGTEAMIPRVLGEYEHGAQMYRAHVKHGIKFEQAVLPQVGDCIEGFVSQGGSLTKRTDLGLTEMVRVYRRLLWAQIRTYAAIAPKILIPVVPGNHDEAHRVGNKMATTYTDSWAIEAASSVQDAVLENPDLADRVRFVFPEYDELTVTVDVSGTILGLAHGHQFGKNFKSWWDAQAGGRQPIGDADVLVAGHLHHFHSQEHGKGKLFIQVPALDGGSNFYRHRAGQDSRARSVTFWTANGRVYDLDGAL